MIGRPALGGPLRPTHQSARTAGALTGRVGSPWLISWCGRSLRQWGHWDPMPGIPRVCGAMAPPRNSVRPTRTSGRTPAPPAIRRTAARPRLRWAGSAAADRPLSEADSSHPADTQRHGRSNCAVRLGDVLQILEEHRQRPRPVRPGRRGSRPQRLPEVGIGIRRGHLPQRPAEPAPDCLQMARVGPDRAVGQPSRRPGQDEPSQDIRLVIRKLLAPDRRPPLTKVTHRSQRQPTPQSFNQSQ